MGGAVQVQIKSWTIYNRACLMLANLIACSRACLPMVLCTFRSQRSQQSPRVYGGPLDLELGALLRDKGIDFTAKDKKTYYTV